MHVHGKEAVYNFVYKQMHQHLCDQDILEYEKSFVEYVDVSGKFIQVRFDADPHNTHTVFARNFHKLVVER